MKQWVRVPCAVEKNELTIFISEYCVAHLRLLNRLCKYCPPGDEAFEFHSDLFASGIDKVLLVSNAPIKCL